MNEVHLHISSWLSAVRKIHKGELCFVRADRKRLYNFCNPLYLAQVEGNQTIDISSMSCVIHKLSLSFVTILIVSGVFADSYNGIKLSDGTFRGVSLLYKVDKCICGKF